jgi:hypothetical protein
MTENEILTLQKYEKFLMENQLSNEFIVSILKLTCDYQNIGSSTYLSELHRCSKQYANRKAAKITVNGVNLYQFHF